MRPYSVHNKRDSKSANIKQKFYDKMLMAGCETATCRRIGPKCNRLVRLHQLIHSSNEEIASSSLEYVSSDDITDKLRSVS